MIITLKDTTAAKIAARLVETRDDTGTSALSRVFTLLIVVPDMIDVDHAIELSDAISREHPCTVIVVVDHPNATGERRLNAQLRIGDTAGMSDVIVLDPQGDVSQDLDLLVMPLLASDTPIVTFWPEGAPDNPGEHPLGRIAVRRITDSRTNDHPIDELLRLSEHYVPGDTDLAWSGVTLWRGMLATIAGEFTTLPREITVRGHTTHPGSFLIASWLYKQLGVPVRVVTDPAALTVTGVIFAFDDDTVVSLEREAHSSVAALDRTGFDETKVNLPRRSTQDCLMEELRRLEPDEYYGALITQELHHFTKAEDAE